MNLRQATSRRRSKRLAAAVHTCESLEQRRLLSGIYTSIAGQLGTTLDRLDTAMGAVSLGANKLPIINKAATQIDEIRQTFSRFKNQLTTPFGQFSNLTNPSAAQIQNVIFTILGPAGAGTLGDRNHDSQLTAADVSVSNLTASSVMIAVDLAKSFTFDSQFGLGIDSIPFLAKPSSAATLTIGLSYLDFTFGWQNGGFVFNDAPPNHATDELQFSVHGWAPSALNAVLGFLDVTAGDLTDNTPNNRDLDVNLVVDVQVPNSNPAQATLADPRLDGDLHLHLGMNVGTTVKWLPKIQAEMWLDWEFDNVALNGSHGSFGSPTLQFKGVKLDLGSTLSSIIKPLVESVQTALGPIQPVFDVLTYPIPGFNEIGQLVGYGKVDLLKLIGEILPGAKEFFPLIDKTLEIIGTINDITTSLTQTYMIPLGEFVAGTAARGGGSNLLGAGASLLNSGDFSDVRKSLSELIPLGDSGIDFGDVKVWITNNVPLGGDIIEFVFDAFSGLHGQNGVKFDFPILDHPEDAVFQLLLGQNPDLISLEARLQASPMSGLSGLSIAGVPFGLSPSGFSAGIEPDIFIKVGYDTFGLRRVVQETVAGNLDPEDIPALLLEGIYVDKDSHARLLGGVSASIGGTVAVFSAEIEGGIAGSISLDLRPAIADKDGELQKIRPLGGEMHDTAAINLSGSVYAYLRAHVAVGVSLPVVGFIGVEENFDLANSTMLSFNIGGARLPTIAPNPFKDANVLLASPVPVVGGQQLRINIGPNASFGNYPQPRTDESVYVSYLPADATNPNRYRVSGMGYIQYFPDIGYTQIYADGGSDADRIIVAASVPSHVDVFLKGSENPDTIEYRGAGNAVIEGGGNDDRLIGGNGNNTIIGGNGNDQITGGSGGPGTMNFLFGDFSTGTATPFDVFENFITAGNAPVFAVGGDDSDRIVGSPYADTLQGFVNNADRGDHLIGNGGNDLLMGWGGNDSYEWHLGDGSDTINDRSNSANSKSDGVSITGGPIAENFIIRKQVSASAPYNTLIDLPGGATMTLGAQFEDAIEEVSIDPGGGADFVDVQNLEGALVKHIAVNTAVLRSPDNALDRIDIAGRPTADTFTIEEKAVGTIGEYTENGLYKILDTGGVMKVDRSDYNVWVGNLSDDLNISTFAADDIVNFHSSTGPTDIFTGDGDDWLLLGASSTVVGPYNLDGFIGTVTADAGTGANDLLSLLDPLSASSPTYDFSPGLFDRTGFPLLAHAGFDRAGLTSTQHDDTVNFNGLSDTSFLLFSQLGNDTININSLPAGFAFAAFAEDGDDTFNLNTATNQDMSAVTVDGGNGTDTLRLNDAARTSNTSYTLSAAGITRAGLTTPPGAVDTFERLAVLAGSGNDTFTINGMSGGAGRITLLDGGSGDDAFVVNDMNNLASAQTQGNFSVIGGLGSDRLFVDNSIDTVVGSDGRSYYGVGSNDINQAYIDPFNTYTFHRWIEHDQVETLRLTAGNSPDQIWVNGIDPEITRMEVNGGGGNDNIDVQQNTINSDTVITQSAGLDSVLVNTNTFPGRLRIETPLSLSSLTVTNGGRVIDVPGAGLLRIGSLSLQGDGTLNLSDNDLIVTNTPKSTIENYIRTAYNFDQWNGPGGISSSTAAANPNDNTMLGLLTGAEYLNNSGSNQFDGVAVTASDVLVKYTYYGDVDFNGQVDTTDYNLIDFGFLTGATGWANGDADHNGQVDTTDYNLIDFAFLTQSGVL